MQAKSGFNGCIIIMAQSEKYNGADFWGACLHTYQTMSIKVVIESWMVAVNTLKLLLLSYCIFCPNTENGLA